MSEDGDARRLVEPGSAISAIGVKVRREPGGNDKIEAVVFELRVPAGIPERYHVAALEAATRWLVHVYGRVVADSMAEAAAEADEALARESGGAAAAAEEAERLIARLRAGGKLH